MPKTVLSYRFTAGTNGYFQDIGTEISVTGRFVLPPDVTDAEGQNIIAAVGALPNTDNVPCSDTGLGDLRKLTFIRESGNTMSIAVPLKGNVITAATTIKSILDKADNNVVCIKLDGEYFANLNDELGVTYTAGDTATSHKAPSSAKKQNYLTGSISYTSDVSGAILHSVHSITEKTDESPAAQLGSTWDSCTGGIQDVLACGNGRRNPRKHRRFIGTFVTKLDPTDTNETAQTETIEVPVAAADSSDILTCGQAVAGLTGLYCIGYRGESYSRIHKLL